MVQAAEGLRYQRIELDAGQLVDLLDRPLDRPRLLVRALVDQCVEDVGDSDDPAMQRDVLTRQPVRIAAAVPRLVMAARDLLGTLEDREIAAAQDLGAHARVRLHQVELFVGQVRVLQQDLVGDPDLADVVQRCGAAKDFDLGGAEPDRGGEQSGGAPDALSVLLRVVVAVLCRQRQALQQLEPGLFQVGGALADSLLEVLVAVEQLQLQAPRLEQVGDPQAHLDRLERLAQEVVGAGGQRALARRSGGVGRQDEDRDARRPRGDGPQDLHQLEAVRRRHLQVEQDQVGRRGLAEVVDRRGVDRDSHVLVAPLRKHPLQQDHVRLLVVDYEDACPGLVACHQTASTAWSSSSTSRTAPRTASSSSGLVR